MSVRPQIAIRWVKKSPYGEIETLEVGTVSFESRFYSADLIKIDVEGFEADLIESLDSLLGLKCDIILEVGSPENARRVFQRCMKIGFNVWAKSELE